MVAILFNSSLNNFNIRIVYFVFIIVVVVVSIGEKVSILEAIVINYIFFDEAVPLLIYIFGTILNS